MASGDLLQPVAPARPFCLMTSAVTGTEFRRFLASLPASEQDRIKRALKSSGGSESLANPAAPMSGVPWDVARGYATWLSRETGRAFDLPTQAEWLAALGAWWRDRLTDDAVFAAARDLMAGRFEWTATACGKGGDQKFVMMGLAQGAPPSGGIHDLCRHATAVVAKGGALRLRFQP
ncbi:MAG: SUMF1/EgtB/PvdO family nonheme iron enzyme [Alphaproteobacteria bacterium]|nr:SUMF1/EgtB/PvdO family nonheme iron enzyme [Alphaproteobacteria bacterium]